MFIGIFFIFTGPTHFFTTHEGRTGV